MLVLIPDLFFELVFVFVSCLFYLVPPPLFLFDPSQNALKMH